MYHKLTIVGYLGRDPEMRYTPDGTAVTNFSVASTRRWNNPDGSKGEETTWFRVAAWRRQAETAAQYLHKGSLVLVEGRLNPNQHGNPRVWKGEDGQPHASFEVTAETIRFLDRKGAGNGNGQPTPAPQTPPEEGIGEDEILPF